MKQKIQEKQSSSQKWQRRKQSRPGEIVAAALELFVERGFTATKLDDVARKAGISKGTLYLYFESKEALFRAVVRDVLLPQLEQADILACIAYGAEMARERYVEIPLEKPS